MATRVYAGNTVVAEQRNDFGEYVVWHHKDPRTQSFTTSIRADFCWEPVGTGVYLGFLWFGAF